MPVCCSVGVKVTLRFSHKQKVAKDDGGLIAKSRASSKDRSELAFCDGKHSLTVYLALCGLKLQDGLNTAM
jgi:hypothetical protein